MGLLASRLGTLIPTLVAAAMARTRARKATAMAEISNLIIINM
jgi:hypothetical protein